MTYKSIFTAAIVAATAGAASFVAAPVLADNHKVAMAAQVPMVGGAPMYPTKNIVENALNSKDHTTLVVAVKAAGLVEALAGPGPFTVFAPTNAAFAKLPAGTVQTLLKEENKGTLTAILTYHVVAGNISSAKLIEMIKAGGGKAELTTLSGGKLTARVVNGKVVVTDAKGGETTVTQADVFQSNGVIHVTDGVFLPG